MNKNQLILTVAQRLRKTFLAAACLLFALHSGTIGMAQQSAATVMKPANTAPSTITVDQAVDEALENNLELFAQRADLTIAETRLITARLRPNPRGR